MEGKERRRIGERGEDQGPEKSAERGKAPDTDALRMFPSSSNF